MKTKPKKIKQTLALVATINALMAAINCHATTYYLTNSGAWNISANWSPNGTPGSADTVNITNSSKALTGLGGANQSCTALNITGTGAATVDANALTVSGTATVGSSGIATLTVASGATMIVGTLTFGDSTSTVTNNGTMSFAGIGGSGSAGQLTQGVNAFLTNSSTSGSTPAFINATAAGNTVVYNVASGNNQVQGTTYQNLTFLGGANPGSGWPGSVIVQGTLTIGGTVNPGSGPVGVGALTWNSSGSGGFGTVVTNNLNVTAGTFYVNSAALTVGGTTTVSGGTLELNGSSFLFKGNFLVNGGTFTPGSATVTYGGNFTLSSGTINAFTGVQTFTNTVNGADTTISVGTLTIPSVTVAANSVVTNASTLTVSTALAGTGTLVQAPNATLNIGGTSTVGTLNASAGGNTVNYNKSNTQTALAATYNNLTLSGTSVKTISASTTVNGTLSIQGTASVSSGGNLTYGASSTLAYAGSSQQTTATELPTGGVPNLTINNASGVLLGGNSSVSGTLTLTAGTLNLNGHTLSAGSVSTGTGNIVLKPTVTLNNYVYDGTTGPTTIATWALAGALTEDTVSLGTSGTVAAFSSANVGSYTPAVTGLALSSTPAYYSLSTTSVSPSVSITKATATVVVTPYSVTYDGNAHTATAGIVTGVDGQTGATVGTVTLTGTTHTAAGIYPSDSWTLTGGANYNNISATAITDTIYQATVTPTVTLNNYVYDGTTGPTTIASRSLGGVVAGDVNNVSLGTSGTVAAFSSPAVGNYTLSVTGLALTGSASGNYQLSTTSVSSSANITLAGSTVTLSSGTTFTYNGTAQTPTFTFAGSSGAQSYSYSGTGYGPNANAPTNAGSYTVMAMVAADSNYNGATNTTSFTINQATNSILLTSSVNPSLDVQLVTFAAVVQTNGMTAGDATSNVVFQVDSVPVATNLLSGGQATYSATLDGGGHTIEADYSGDNNYFASTNTLSQAVLPTYAVTYSGNGNTDGSAPVDPNTYTNGATVTVQANSGGLTQTGYTFADWNTAPDGSGVSYPGDGSGSFTMGSANVTLYAQWASSCTAPTILGGIDASAYGTNVCVGSPVILTLTNATGTATLFYQWQTNDIAITGATNASYTNLSMALTDAGNYACVVGNGCGSITSSVVILTVNSAPTITTASLPDGVYNVAYGLTVAGSGGSTPYTFAAFGLPPGLSMDTNGVISGTPASAGTSSVVITVTSASGCVGSAALNLTIDPATPTLSVGNPSVTYNGLAQTATVNPSVSGTVSNVEYNGSTNIPIATGTYAITADFASSNGNYSGLTGASAGNFVINQASVLVGASSTENPSGYGDAVSFLASLPADAMGSVVFSTTNGSISTNGMSDGVATSLSVTNLPRGTNLITLMYSGDGNYLGSTNTLDQVVTNHPPVAGNAVYTINSSVSSLVIQISDLLTNVTDQDGDTITLVGTGVSTNGITLAMVGTNYLDYYNTNHVNDQFSYTVTDGFGGTNSGIVTINVDTTPLFGQSNPTITTVGGVPTMTFAGIPNYSYSVQRSTNVTFVPAEIIWTTNAPSGGIFQFIDFCAPATSAFYRLEYNP